MSNVFHAVRNRILRWALRRGFLGSLSRAILKVGGWVGALSRGILAMTRVIIVNKLTRSIWKFLAEKLFGKAAGKAGKTALLTRIGRFISALTKGAVKIGATAISVVSVIGWILLVFDVIDFIAFLFPDVNWIQ